jgi:prepilin-type N-terminal cleavage/methylation domain-containing protein
MLTKFTKNNEKGFTLIELMIVIAIIGILAAIAIPQFSAYRQRSFNSSANADLRNAATAQEAYYVDSMTYTNTIGDLIGTYGLYTSHRDLWPLHFFRRGFSKCEGKHVLLSYGGLPYQRQCNLFNNGSWR